MSIDSLAELNHMFPLYYFYSGSLGLCSQENERERYEILAKEAIKDAK